ncbi:hypothetical protein GCM10007304_07170 [Rhodococcoides trifolii]|uniref:Uncharacterized protein n=1 Tax=Rhodococcoides trifolii TaxID=908250 RepID=A0A917CQW3_9NOCA|nr:hypothetical protein [Rhodococcus trifolii]GGF95862.1 hypothetical protein GCM10007304_07170 [Rhodococcus trifolii]
MTDPNWNWHPEGLPPSAMPGPNEFEKYTAPVDVETARHLWFGAVLLGLFGLVLGLYSVFADRDAYVRELLQQVQAQDPSVTVSADTADSVLTVAIVVAVLMGGLVAALFWLVVTKMRAGKLWARAVLTFFGAIVVVTAIPSLFALTASNGATSVLTSVSGILQAVLAAGAIVLMHRKDSTRYFIATRPKM